ncbi:DUF6602 domain-containing protein [Microbacterium sp. P07]|uniref:DUF6602 domain-containing protein n=1 Tax=Microbacterium sp. P07 TaxID=3366952 RepID=UPI003745F5D8
MLDVTMTHGTPKATEREERPHELAVFLSQDLDEISSEYTRIRARTKEDPGTAGDEGEENWAELLRRWLPATYTIVTKGRILGADGSASPQVDVIVLKPSYPPRLASKKVYLVSGVAAVFECKTTLTVAHVKAAFRTAKIVKNMGALDVGTFQKELKRGPIFGLVAHSHSWNSPRSDPLKNMDSTIQALHRDAEHPRDLLDVVCVSDLASWNLHRVAYVGPVVIAKEHWEDLQLTYGLPAEGGVMTAFPRRDDTSPSNPVAVLVAMLLQAVAWEDPGMRPLADYFRLAGLWGSGGGATRNWPLGDVYSPQTIASIAGHAVPAGWNEWAIASA